MCLNLINSQFRTIKEVEKILNSEHSHYTEKDIIAMKDDRKKIDETLEKIDNEYEFWDMIDAIGL